MEKPSPIQAVQHIRKMRGGSQAHLIRASDNHLYITKFQNNPQHVRILANDYLGTKLGTLLGLPMPEVRIIDAPESLIVNSPELKIENGALTVSCVSGLQFGSRYVADPAKDRVFDYLPDSMFHRIANPDDFPRVLVFDKWTGNSDGRQAAFVKSPGTRSYRALFIDQGHCFNAGEWNFTDSPLRGTFARNAVYQSVTGWEFFEPVLSRVEKIEFADLWSIAREIPQEWYQHDISGLAGLMQALYDRCVLVRELITGFRKSSRNPFSNWI